MSSVLAHQNMLPVSVQSSLMTMYLCFQRAHRGSLLSCVQSIRTIRHDLWLYLLGKNPYSGRGMSCIRSLFTLLSTEAKPLTAQVGFTQATTVFGKSLFSYDEPGFPKYKTEIVPYSELNRSTPYVPITDNDERLCDHNLWNVFLPTYIQVQRVYPQKENKFGWKVDDMTKSPRVCFQFTTPVCIGKSRKYNSMSRAIAARNRFVLHGILTPSDPKSTWPTLPLQRSVWYPKGAHPLWSQIPLPRCCVHHFFGELKWPETTD